MKFKPTKYLCNTSAHRYSKFFQPSWFSKWPCLQYVEEQDVLCFSFFVLVHENNLSHRCSDTTYYPTLYSVALEEANNIIPVRGESSVTANQDWSGLFSLQDSVQAKLDSDTCSHVSDNSRTILTVPGIYTTETANGVLGKRYLSTVYALQVSALKAASS